MVNNTEIHPSWSVRWYRWYLLSTLPNFGVWFIFPKNGRCLDFGLFICLISLWIYVVFVAFKAFWSAEFTIWWAFWALKVGSIWWKWQSQNHGSMMLALCYSWVFPGGGNSNIFYFHPESWGNDPFWLIFFRWVVQPPVFGLFCFFNVSFKVAGDLPCQMDLLRSSNTLMLEM